MSDLNITFDTILNNKQIELLEYVIKCKTKKVIETSKVDDINYNVKTTLAKIHAEQDRKLKMSKTYKKKELQEDQNNQLKMQT
jgi:hypothetical protein